MRIPLLDLKAQYAVIRDEIDTAVREVLESQYFILGPRVRAFEDTVAAYSGTAHAVGCASGSDALLLALMTLGVEPGDEVITTPYTFFSTASAISRLGATPVFCDINPDTFNIDPDHIEGKITEKTRVILPVHLYGLVADMDRIGTLARKHSLGVVEDAAQAIGAGAPSGKAGSLGDMGCFSFFPSKNLGGAGDGGMVVTDNDSYAEALRIIRVHGSKPKYYHSVIGINSRLDALQAAVLDVKLKYLDTWSEARRANAALYTRFFAAKGLSEQVVTPIIPGGYSHIFNQYVIRVKNRNGLREHLKNNDIGSEIYYPVPLHLQECFAYLGYSAGDMPVSEEAAETTLALPVYPELTGEMQEYVVDTIAAFYR